MTFFHIRLVPVFLIALLSASCVTAPQVQPLPAMTFSHLTPLSLAVASMTVEAVEAPSYGAGSLEASAPVTLTRAVDIWARARLQPVGGIGAVARLIVRRASLTEHALVKTPGLKGVFIKDQSVRYEADLEVELHIELDGSNVGVVVAEANHARTVSEDATINDRRRVQYEVVEALMANFDQEMEKNLRAHLGRWLR